MGKRENENAQLSKEEYEALDQRGGSSGGGAIGFEKADAETLSKRRIVRRAGAFRKGIQSASSAPAGGGSGSAAAPFQNFSFTKPASSPAAPPAANPFAKIQLAAPSVSASTAPSATAGLPSLSTSSKATTTTFASASSSSTNTSGNSKLKALGKEFEKHQSTVDISTDPSLALLQYVATYQNLEASSSKSKTSSSTTTTTSSSAPTTSLFGGSSAPAPSPSITAAATKPLFPPVPAAAAPEPLSSATSTSEPSKPLFPAASAAGSSPGLVPFSFASAPAPGTSSATPTFSFGKPVETSTTPAPAPSAAASAASAGNSNGDDNAPVPAEETAPLEKADVDWNEVFELNVKIHRKSLDKKAAEWSKAVKGPLKIQEHKTNSSRRLVMRDASGKVLFNVGISKGMGFTKSTDPPRAPGKGPTAKVTFAGLESTDRGNEMFLIICRADMLDEFHSKLEELASK